MNESEQFAARDHLRRAIYARMTPDERIARARANHEWAIRQLQSNPEGFERLWRRNLRKRAVKPFDKPQVSHCGTPSLPTPARCARLDLPN